VVKLHVRRPHIVESGGEVVDISGADFAVARDVGPLEERHVGVHVRLLDIRRLEQHPHHELEFLDAATILVEALIRE
tara:strand:+ start:619 stop:849 length:231 start_codon:yes stop_codon:yes gene_type:complete